MYDLFEYLYFYMDNANLTSIPTGLIIQKSWINS